MSSTTTLDGARGPIPVYVARPTDGEPRPGVVVVHDALGMSTDLRGQADWLRSEGFIAAAPDLYLGDRTIRCIRSVMRDAARGHGPTFHDLHTVRQWLAEQPECTGSIAMIGFCLGGAFAILLAPTGDYDAVSVNYGAVPKDIDSLLEGACPIVASYGAKDRTLRRASAALEAALRRNDIAHDLKVYPDAGHSFLNDHDDSDVPFVIRVVGWVTRSEYHEPSAADARRRISAFLHHHLDD